MQPCQRCRSTRFRRSHDGTLTCGACGQVYSEYREQLGDPEHDIYSGGSSITLRGRRILPRVIRTRDGSLMNSRALQQQKEQNDAIHFDNETEYVKWAIQDLLIRQLQFLMRHQHVSKYFEVCGKPKK
jgi:uncharacterized Zn finger protein (UPF0148 family)